MLLYFILLMSFDSLFNNSIEAFNTAMCDANPSSKELQKRAERIKRKEDKTRSNPYARKWFREKQNVITKSQKRALHDHWNTYGLEINYGYKLNFNELALNQKIKLNDSFQINIEDTNVDVILDIGFGKGDSLIGLASSAAQSKPNEFYFGLELMRSGVAVAIQRLAELKLTNCMTAKIDAARCLNQNFEAGSIMKALIYFPDPWTREADIERRVVRTTVIHDLHKIIKKDGILHIVTDVDDYAAYCRKLLEEEKDKFRLLQDMTYAPTKGAEEGAPERPVTVYEQKAIEKGNQIHDITYERI